MTPLLTCKDFLKELSAYLDDDVDPQLKADLKKHVSECPNCWVVCDTTEKTVKIYKGMEAQPLPESMQNRLMSFLSQRCKEKQPSAESPVSEASSGRYAPGSE